MALLWRAKDLPLSGGLWDQTIPPPTAPSHSGATDFQWLSLKPLGHTTQNEDNYTCREQDPRGRHAENTNSPYSGPYSLRTLLTALQLSTETPSSCVSPGVTGPHKDSIFSVPSTQMRTLGHV